MAINIEYAFHPVETGRKQSFYAAGTLLVFHTSSSFNLTS